MPDTDPLAAYLAEVRDRSESRVLNPGSLPITHPGVRVLMESAGDVPRLLAAVEAVLAQHQPGRIVILGALCRRHKEHRHFSITSTEAASVMACQECTATVFNSCTGCGPPVSLESCPARKAISAALLGGVGGDDAAASTVPHTPKGSPVPRVVVTPSQVDAARLLTERAAGEHGPAVQKIAGAGEPTARVTRFEVIDHRTGASPRGRILTTDDEHMQVTLSRQDDGTTLKVFLDSRDAEGERA